MEDVMTSGTGTRAYFGADMAQAGKSGTTTGNRDCLFAGFTPYYTLVVWGGYDDNSQQAKGQTTYPKTIWKAVMSRIHEDLEYKDFEQPSGIQTELVCKTSGKLAQDHLCEYDQRGSMVFSEFFAQDNMPTEECDKHISVNICTESGMVAGAFCPEDGIETVVYVKSAVDKLTGLDDSGSTNDAGYVITEEELSNFCTLHDENSVGPPEIPDEDEPDEETPPEEGITQGGNDDPVEGIIQDGGEGTDGTPDDGEEPDVSDFPDIEENPDDGGNAEE
jgi:penicillin-binding protein 1A